MAGVHNSHVEPSLDAVVKEGGIDGFANDIVSAKTETDIADAARYLGSRTLFLDSFCSFKKVDRVVVMFFHARGDGQNVRVKDNVFGRESNFINQDVVGFFANGNLVIRFHRLPCFVERHNDYCGAVAANQSGFAFKLLKVVFHRDRVDDRLALNISQSGFDDLPLGAVDHDWHGADIGLTRDEPKEFGHCLDAIEQCIVHVDVDDCRAAFDLIASDFKGFLVIALTYESSELSRAGHVGPLTHHQKVRIVTQSQRLGARESRVPWDFVFGVRRKA